MFRLPSFLSEISSLKKLPRLNTHLLTSCPFFMPPYHPIRTINLNAHTWLELGEQDASLRLVYMGIMKKSYFDAERRCWTQHRVIDEATAVFFLA